MMPKQDSRIIYGLKQAAREYWQLFVRIMKELGSEQGKADPCMFIIRKQGEMAIVIAHVDDLLITGDDNVTTWFRNELSRRLEVKFEGRVCPQIC